MIRLFNTNRFLKSKRMLRIILVFLFLLIFYFCSILELMVYADDIEDIADENIIETHDGIDIANVEASNNLDSISINSRAGIIFDRTSKRVMWGKNIDDRRAMASTTKIMTAIVVLENSNLDSIVTVSKKAANTGGSRLKINTGDKISVRDLLYGLMLCSGNDAAVALAEHVGGSVDDFAKMMNKKKEDLGLINTNFVTPHGLDDDMHYTTAYELAVLTDYALNNETFKKIVNTKSYNISINGNTRTINNTNELLGYMEGVDGVKTGYTGKALRCLVTSCTRDNKQIITIVLGADTKKNRTEDSIKLINYAFSKFEWADLKELVNNKFEEWKSINRSNFNVNKGITNTIDLKLEDINVSEIPIKKGDINNIEITFNCIYDYNAPLLNKTKIGNAIIKYDNKIVESVNIINENEISKKTVFNYMLEFLVNFQTCLDF